MTTLFIFDGADDNRSLELKDGTYLIGRSPKSNIHLKDMAVSRMHLRLTCTSGRFFICDLKSRNGSFVDGDYITPQKEVELKEGVPIVLGMSVLCFGEGCSESVAPILKSMEISQLSLSETVEIQAQRCMTSQKNLDLIQKVDSVLMESMDLWEISNKILNYILELFKRMDRGVIFLKENEQEEIEEVIISKNRIGEKGPVPSYCRQIIDQVINNGNPVLISDVQKNSREISISDTLRLLNIKSVICVPMLSDMSVIGAIYIDSIHRPDSFRKDDLSLLMELSKKAVLAIENAVLYETLNH